MEAENEKFDKVLKIINKHELKGARFAREMGIKTSTFNLKLHKTGYNRFTINQKAEILELLTQLRNDISDIL
jgi:hypothetical protein